MRFTALVATALAAPAAALLLQNAGDASQRAWSKTGMRPEVAARMLGEVELKWVHGKLSVLMGEASEDALEQDVMPSCGKIVQAIMQGSGGEINKVNEYMDDVCEESAAAGYDKYLCASFAQGCAGIMTADLEFNRDSLDGSKFCKSFLAGPITEAAKKWQEAADDEAEKKAAAATSTVEVVTTQAAAKEETATTEAAPVTEVAAKEDASTEAASSSTTAPVAEVSTEQSSTTVAVVATSSTAAPQEVSASPNTVEPAVEDVDDDSDSASDAKVAVADSTNTSDITDTLNKLKESQALKAKVHRHRAQATAEREKERKRMETAKLTKPLNK